MPLLDFAKFGIKNTASYDYVIGFDLGDSQTSAAIFRLNDPAWTQPKDLYVGPGEATKIATALVYDNGGNIVVDKTDALLSFAGTDHQLASHFKVRPARLKTDEPHPGTPFTKRKLVVEFLRVAIQNIFHENPPELLRGRGLLGIGCPSSPDWLADGMDLEYARILRAALRDIKAPLDIVIMPESRAALLKAYRDKAFDADFLKALRNGVIVIDHGSSTLDITAIDFSAGTQRDMSVNLGARLIERAMERRVLGLNSVDESELIASKAWRLLDLRIVKEALYTNPRGIRQVYFEKKDRTSFKGAFDTPFMQYITSGMDVSYSSPSTGPVSGPWEKLHSDFLEKCRAAVCPDGKPFEGVVILTGGASRMDFTLDTARRVFGPAASYERDSDPGFCVSRGLAWGLRTDLEAMKLTGRVAEEARDAVRKIFRSWEFHSSLAKALATYVYHTAEAKVARWIHTDTSRTLQNVIDDIQYAVTKDSLGRAGLTDVYNASLRGLLDKSGPGSIRATVADTINRIFNSYFPNRIEERAINTFSITSDQWKGIVNDVVGEADFLVSDTLMDHIDLEGYLSKAFKGILALVLLVPGVILSFFDGIFGTSMADDLMSLTDEDRFKTYSYEERKKVYDGLVKSKDEIISSLQSTLQPQVLSDEKADSLGSCVVRNLRPAIDKAVDNVSLYFTVTK